MQALSINRYPITIAGETTHIGTANELSIALDVLQGQSDREALVQLAPHLGEIIAHASGLLAVMRSLSVENQIYLIQAIGPDLVDVMQNAVHLRDILATLFDPGVEAALLSALDSSGLRQLIQTGPELAEVLEWVYGECDELALDLLGDDAIRQLCRHAADLSAILHSLDFSVQARLLERLGWPFVVGLVNGGRDLAYLLRALPPENSAQLLHHFSGQRLRELIGNASEWNYLYQRLEPAEADLLLGLLIRP